jgi:hypothetical protein
VPRISTPRHRPSSKWVNQLYDYLPTLTLTVSVQKKRIGYIKTSTIKPTAFAHTALSLGDTGPALERGLAYQEFVIAFVCKFQVVLSHGYINFPTIDNLRQRFLNRYTRIGLEGDSQVPGPPGHPFRTVREGLSWEGGGPIQLPHIPQESTIANNYRQYQDSEGIETDSHEKRGHFIGISKSVGHAMTFKILTDDTLKVIHQYNVRSALNPHDKNLRLDPLEPGDVATPIIKSRHDSVDDGEILPLMPVIDPSELIGRTFLMDKEDGQRHCALILNVIDEEEICKCIGEHERELFWQHGHIQFVCSVNNDEYEEILSYNELMDYIEKNKQQHQDKDSNGFWNIKRIVGQEGPFRASDPEYKGSRYNVLIEWENGEITS